MDDISTYIWLNFMVNAGKYTSPMDAMGILHPICACRFVPCHSDLIEA